MNVSTALAIGGGLCGTLGSIITAFSLSRLLTELHLANELLRITVESYITERQDVPLFKGTDKRHESAEKHGTLLTWLGVVLLALGFILQAASAVSGTPAAPRAPSALVAAPTMKGPA